MKHIYTKLTFLLLLLLGSTSLFGSTYYSKLTGTASPTGAGKVYINDAEGSNTQDVYDNQTHTYNIKATANDGYEFTSWSAGSGVTVNGTTATTTCTFTATATKSKDRTTKSVTANFQALPVFYFKSVAKTNSDTYGNAYTTFTSSAASSTTSATANVRGATLSTTSATKTAYFRAVAKSGYVFKGWSTTSSESNIFNTNASITYDLTSSKTSSSDPATITYYAIFGEKFVPIITGTASKTIDVGDSYTADFTFTNTSTAKPSASSSDDFYYTISHQLSSSVNNGSNVISYDPATNTVTALNAGTAIITFTNKTTATHEGKEATFTITVNKKTPTFSCGTSVDVDANITSSYTNTSAATPTASTSDNFYYVITNNTPTGNTAGSNSPNAIIAFANNKVTGKNAGTATITFYQKETYQYSPKSQAFNVKVSKLSATLKANNSTAYSPTMYFNATLSGVTLTSTNADYTNSPIKVEQTLGKDTAEFEYTQSSRTGVIKSKYFVGNATWKMTQAENYKYKDATGTFSVNVQKQAETACYVLETGNTDVNANNNWEEEYNLSGYGKHISIDAYTETLVTAKLTITGYADDGSSQTLLDGKSLAGSWTTYTCDVPDGFKCSKIKVSFANGLGKKHFRNLQVTRKTYLNPTMTSTSFTTDDDGNPIYRSINGHNYEGHQTLTVNWSISNGGNLKIVSTNPKFTLSQNTISNTDCKNGSDEITVTYKSADAGTDKGKIVIYNDVWNKTIDVTGTTVKRNQTIVWNTDLTTIPVGFQLSAETSEHQPVTFKSYNESVISVSEDKKTLTVLAAGDAKIEATGAGNAEFNEVKEEKTFTVTDNYIQYIVWNQNLMNLVEGGSNVTLIAEARTDSAGTFPTRKITYISSDETVVKVVVENDTAKLQIVGKGTTYVTAYQNGGSDGAGHVFAAASPVQKKVVVRDPNAACENFVLQQDNEYELFSSSTSKPELIAEFSLSGEPEYLSVDLKRKYYKVPIVGWKYSSGELVLEQYYNNQWNHVRTFAESELPLTEDGSAHNSLSRIRLDRRATKIRFRRPQGGEGYHYVSNCEVTLARYIETNETSIAFGQMNVGSEATHNSLQLSYNNIQSSLTLSTNNAAFAVSPTSIDGTCGDKGKQNITVTYHPTAPSNADNAELTITDGKTTRKVTLSGSAVKPQRTIHWDDYEEENDVFTINTFRLKATVSMAYDASIIVGTVKFRLAQGSTTGTITDNVLSFAKSGKAIVEAYVDSDDNYEDPTVVTKTFNVAIVPIQIDELPEIKAIAVNHPLSDVLFEGGKVSNTYNGETVGGTFAAIAGETSTIGTTTLTVRFTPTEYNLFDTYEYEAQTEVVTCTFDTNGEWGNEDNWNTSAVPHDNDDVIIDADVRVVSDVEVKDIIIREEKTVTVADGASLTINGTTGNVTTYGNIIVEAGGQLILGSGNVEVNDFTLYSGYDEGLPKSGQVSNPTKIHANGNAYFILDLDPAGEASYGWYDFTVPFPVNVMTGVARSADGINWDTNIQNEKNYAVMAFYEELRAQDQYAWKKFRGILEPGRAYTMTIDSKINTYRFAMTQEGTFNTTMTQTLEASAEGEENGWNGVGNGTMQYIKLSEQPVVQMYQHTSNVYLPVDAGSQAFAVGSAYFVQKSEQLSQLTLVPVQDATSVLRAPQRERETDERFGVTLTQDGKTCDNLFVTCSDEATTAYTRGKDVQKMGNIEGAKIARLWTNAKGKNLCAIYTACTGNETVIPMNIYAPAAGAYNIALTSLPEEDIYLTRNGVIVWDLTMSDYTLDLNAGTDNTYALMVVRRINNTATGVDATDNDKRGTDFVKKIIVNDQLFILRDGIMYDAQGKRVTENINK